MAKNKYQLILLSLTLGISLQVQAVPLKADSSKSSAKKKSSAVKEACSSFRNLIKSKRLRDELRSQTSGTENEDLKNLIGAQAFKDLIKAWGEDGAKYVTETDLNHDQVTDYVIEKSEGSAHIGYVAVIVGKKGGKSKFIESVQSEESVTSGVLNRLEGDYLVIFEGDQPSLQIIENDKLKKLCGK